MRVLLCSLSEIHSVVALFSSLQPFFSQIGSSERRRTIQLIYPIIVESALHNSTLVHLFAVLVFDARAIALHLSQLLFCYQVSLCNVKEFHRI